MLISIGLFYFYKKYKKVVINYYIARKYTMMRAEVMLDNEMESKLL